MLIVTRQHTALIVICQSTPLIVTCQYTHDDDVDKIAQGHWPSCSRTWSWRCGRCTGDTCPSLRCPGGPSVPTAGASGSECAGSSAPSEIHEILPTLTDRLPSRCLTRQEETALSHLHIIGHSYLTHLFLLKGEEPPVCVSCDELLSLEHI